jgi:hypothetical protein
VQVDFPGLDPIGYETDPTDGFRKGGRASHFQGQNKQPSCRFITVRHSFGLPRSHTANLSSIITIDSIVDVHTFFVFFF